MEKMCAIIAVVYLIVHVVFPNIIFPNFNKMEEPAKVDKNRRDTLMQKIEAEIKRSGLYI